ncbi:MAG: serine hydrolase [Gemmatimonadota bacterium]|nr:serine hydrolase [Gemmatimonadota bacterium]
MRIQRHLMVTRWLPACVVSIGLAACGDSTTAPPPPLPPVPDGPIELSAPWVEAPPALVGVDEAGLSAAIAQASGIGRLRSLLVVKDGLLIAEEYFGGASVETLHDVRSVTKSVVATLTGIAIDEGHIASLDDPIDLHLDPAVAPLTTEQRAITVRHLLNMTGGFEWDESGGGGDYAAWITSGDHLGFLLDRPLETPPGSAFRYNSAAVHLLGVVVASAVDEPLEIYADRVLFSPLGVTAVAWERLADGFVNGGAGIDLRARDLARLGQLYLQDGVSGDGGVLPHGWVEAATQPAFSWRGSYGALDSYTYGRLWWISESQPETAYLAWGYGGQFIYVVPDLELVVVATTNWSGLTLVGGPGPVERAVLEVIVDRIHPAVR